MKPSNTNAFLKGDSGPTRFPRKGLAGLLAPLRASLDETEYGFSLALEPMHAIDAITPWQSLDPTASGRTLIATSRDRGRNSDRTTARIGDAAGRSASMRESTVANHAEFAAFVLAEGLADDVAVLVDGPIEPGDIRAVEQAIEDGRSPLEADLRAIASMSVDRDRTVRVDTRDPGAAALFVAENLRQYLAALSCRPAASLALPNRRLVELILGRTGYLTVRPIETEVYSSFIDIGINTDPNGALRPADTSVIFDLPGNTWHGED